MKYKSLFALAAAAATMLFACQKPVDLGPEQVSIDSEATHEFPVEGGEYTIQLTATVDWSLQGYDESVQAWLSVSPSSGKASADPQTITISALPNEGADRKADLVFYGNIMCKAPLTITQTGELIEDGTAEHPYSVATALRLIDENGWSGNDNVSEKVYVKGIVSTGIDESDFDPVTYGNATYKISDDGSTESELEVYRGYYLGGVRFTSIDQLKVGDEVIIYGSLTKFYETYELTQGNEIYSLNGETAGSADVGTPEGSGTAEDPYNIAAALKYIDDNQYYGTLESPNVSPEVYVKGIVSTGIDASDFDAEKYGNATYKISDDGTTSVELEVYRGYYLDGEKFTSIDQLQVGDEVVVVGQLTRFFQTYEFTTGSRLYSHNGNGGSGEEPDPDDPAVEEPTSATPVTIAEFLEKPVNNTDWYELTGEVLSISSTSYGNFTIQDETGNVYIYGMVASWADGENDNSFSKIGLEVGDIVTLWSLRDEYEGSPQGGGSDIPALYKSHEEGAPVVNPEGTVVLSFPDDNSANNKINGYDEPWTAISGDYSFTMTQFNNYEWNSWTYVRCGRKVASIAYIETDDAMPKLSSVELTIGSRFDTADVNDLYLAVYSDAGMTQQVGENIEAAEEWGTNRVLTFDIPESIQAENLYYQLTFDCAASSKNRNGLIEVSKVTYIAAE